MAGVDVRLVGAARAHLRPEVEGADADPDEPRHVLAEQPAARDQQPATRGAPGGEGEQVVVADVEPVRRAGGVDRRPARGGRRRGPRTRSASSASSNARWKVHGTPGQRPARWAQTSASTSQVGVEEAEGHPGRPAARGSPRRGRRSRVSSPPVVVHESLSRSSTNTGSSVSRHTAETVAGSGEQVARRRRGGAGRRRPRRHRRRRRGRVRATSSSALPMPPL